MQMRPVFVQKLWVAVNSVSHILRFENHVDAKSPSNFHAHSIQQWHTMVHLKQHQMHLNLFRLRGLFWDLYYIYNPTTQSSLYLPWVHTESRLIMFMWRPIIFIMSISETRSIISWSVCPSFNILTATVVVSPWLTKCWASAWTTYIM